MAAKEFLGKTLEQRFHEKYIPEPNTGCWLWTGTVVAKLGYGNMNRGHSRETGLAHRVSWELHRGPIPKGAWVLHRCDTPSCVNPDHLFLGTRQDNINDSVAKRRHTFGMRNSSAKLTDDVVREIRSSGASAKEMAIRFGISAGHVRAIKRSKRWPHVT